MILSILLLLLGLVLLWFGSDFVIESAKKLASKLRVSHLFIGLTIVSIGTSLPEIFTNIYSAFSNLRGVFASGVAVGIVVGSSITQMTLVVGIVALMGSLKSGKKTLVRDIPIIFLAILLTFLAGLDGFVSRLEGLILVITYMVYLFFLSRDEHRERKDGLLKEPLDAVEIKSDVLKKKPLLAALLMLLGLGLLVLGSKFVVDNALIIAGSLNLTQTFVGVLIIGVGGCIPELSIALRGITRRARGISLGALIGSNITNPLFALGAGTLISGFSFNKSLLAFELPFWALSLITVAVLLKKKASVGLREKKQGLLLIGLYAFFVLMKIVFFRHV